MNPEAYKKLITLNNEFQKVLGQIIHGEGVDEKNWPLQVLGRKGIAEWKLCASYIDWYIEMYGEIGEIFRYDEIILSAVNDFLERYSKNKESFDVITTPVAFDDVLGLLSHCRIQTLSRIKSELLKRNPDKTTEYLRCG